MIHTPYIVSRMVKPCSSFLFKQGNPNCQMLSQENDADRLLDDPDENGPIVQRSSLFIAMSCDVLLCQIVSVLCKLVF